MVLRGASRIAAVCAAVLLLSGCAAPVIGGLTLGTIGTIVDTISTIFTGKSTEEIAVGWILGKDCNLTEGLFRKARKFCEERGSVEAKKDFTGFFPAFGGSGVAPLERYAIALQLERREAVPLPKGVPHHGEPAHLVRIGNDIVYAMAPIYAPGDPMPPTALPAGYSMAPIYGAEDRAPRRSRRPMRLRTNTKPVKAGPAGT